MKTLQPYAEIHIQTGFDDEDLDYKWIKVIDDSESLQPNIEINIQTDFCDDENNDCRRIKIKGDNAYVKNLEQAGIAHYKIDRKMLAKFLERFNDLKEYEQYSTKKFGDFCYIKYKYRDKDYCLNFNYSNSPLLKLANEMFHDLKFLVDFSSYDFEDED